MLVFLHILEVECDGMFAWFLFVDIADAMRGQIDLAILVVWQFEFALI